MNGEEGEGGRMTLRPCLVWWVHSPPLSIYLSLPPSLPPSRPTRQVKALWPDFDVQVFGSEATKVRPARGTGREGGREGGRKGGRE